MSFIQYEFDAKFAADNRYATHRRYVAESSNHVRFIEELQRLRSINPSTLYNSHWVSHYQTLAGLAFSAGELNFFGQSLPVLTPSILTSAAANTDDMHFEEFLAVVGFPIVETMYTQELQLCFDIYHGDHDACCRCPELDRMMGIVGKALHEIRESQSETERSWTDLNERCTYIKLKMCRRDKKHPIPVKNQCERLAMPPAAVGKIDWFTPDQAAKVFNIRPEVMASLLTEYATPSALSELAKKTGYVSRSWRSQNFLPSDGLSNASAASTGNTVSSSADPQKVSREFDRQERNVIWLDDHRESGDDYE